MANTIEVVPIVDGSRNLVLKCHIDGDGTGEETNTVLVDASAYSPAFTEIKLMKIDSNLIGFSAELIWDADTDVHAWQIPDYEQSQDFRCCGGVTNANLTNPTGDILVTTTGLGAGDSGHFILYLKKKNNV